MKTFEDRCGWQGLALLSCTTLLGCSEPLFEGAAEESPSKGAPLARAVEDQMAEAKAELRAANSDEIVGEVYLRQTVAGVRVDAEIEDAMPGAHGLHIHEKGDCSDIPGGSMGGHYAPRGHPHALPHEEGERHLGDLGNVQVQPDGTGRLERSVDHASLEQGAHNNLLGRAVVLHIGEDSGKQAQPAGDSGPAVACGVIEPS